MPWQPPFVTSVHTPREAQTLSPLSAYSCSHVLISHHVENANIEMMCHDTIVCIVSCRVMGASASCPVLTCIPAPYRHSIASSSGSVSCGGGLVGRAAATNYSAALHHRPPTARAILKLRNMREEYAVALRQQHEGNAPPLSMFRSQVPVHAKRARRLAECFSFDSTPPPVA